MSENGYKYRRKPTGRPPISEETRKQIVYMYLHTDKTLTQIAKDAQVSLASVRRILDKELQ